MPDGWTNAGRDKEATGGIDDGPVLAKTSSEKYASQVAMRLPSLKLTGCMQTGSKDSLAHADRQESLHCICKQAGKLPSHMYGSSLMEEPSLNRTACGIQAVPVSHSPATGRSSKLPPALTGIPVRSTAWLSCCHVRACVWLHSVHTAMGVRALCA